MCGIIGMIGYVREGQWGQTHDLLHGLFIASEHRGRDATGFSAVAEPLDNPHNQQLIWSKAPIAASDFVADNPTWRKLRHQRCSSFIGHVRAATHGEPSTGDNRNNHPFVGKHGLSLVHNGIISNYREIADKYSLKLRTECDSEVLLRLIESADNTVHGLQTCLQEVEGAMAVAVLDPKRSWIWLARNSGRPLWLAKLERDRRWFFASTAVILRSAFRSVLGHEAANRIEYLAPVPDDTPIVLSASGTILAPFSF